MQTSPAAHALILAVDDDPAVGRAIERDLKHKYGSSVPSSKASTGRRKFH